MCIMCSKNACDVGVFFFQMFKTFLQLLLFSSYILLSYDNMYSSKEVENTEKSETSLKKAMSPEMDSPYPVRPFSWKVANRYHLGLNDIVEWRTAWCEYRNLYIQEGSNKSIVTPASFKKQILEEPFHPQHRRMANADKELYGREKYQPKNRPVTTESWANEQLTKAFVQEDNKGIENALMDAWGMN